jgi:hypothetical protein
MVLLCANQWLGRRGLVLLPAIFAVGVLAAPGLARAQVFTVGGPGAYTLNPYPGTTPIGLYNVPDLYAPGGYAWVVPYVNPYWYWEAQAAADSQAASNFALAQGSYNLSSMSAGTTQGAGDLINSNLMANYVLGGVKDYASYAPRYNVQTGNDFTSNAGGGSRLVDITSRGGDVLWPLSAPTDGDLADKRKAADTSIRDAIVDFRRTGKGSVEKVNAALRNLTAYADPAAKYLRQHDPGQVVTFMELVRSLDRGLRKLVGEPPHQAPRAQTKPAG